MKFETEENEAILFDGQDWHYCDGAKFASLTPSRQSAGFWSVTFIDFDTWEQFQTTSPAKPWFCARTIQSKGISLSPGLWRPLDITQINVSLTSESGPRTLNPNAIIYAIGAGNFVKIGTTVDLAARVSSLQCGNPLRLSVIGTWSGDCLDEARIHRRFAHLRVRGEWFSLTNELLTFIQERATCKA